MKSGMVAVLVTVMLGLTSASWAGSWCPRGASEGTACRCHGDKLGTKSGTCAAGSNGATYKHGMKKGDSKLVCNCTG